MPSTIPLAAPQIWSRTVTLSSGQVNSLFTLLAAIDQNFPFTGKEINLQVTQTISGGVGGVVFVGDSSMTFASPQTTCGYELNNGDSRLYRSSDGMSSMPVGMLYLVPSVNAMTVHVEIIQ